MGTKICKDGCINCQPLQLERERIVSRYVYIFKTKNNSEEYLFCFLRFKYSNFTQL